MKKQLPTNGIANELVGSSVFFGPPAATEPPHKPTASKQERGADATRPRAISGSIKPPSSQRDSTQPRQRDTTVASNHATMPSREQATTETDQHPVIWENKHDSMPPFQNNTTKADQHPTMLEEKHDPMSPQTSESAGDDEHAATPAPGVPAIAQATLEEVRKAVKPIGKEAATYRLTVAEKQALSDIAYTYQRQGIKTSENEIARIAINWLLLDYQAHKTDGVLARLLDLLHG